MIRIGWASISITPDKPVQLWGQFHERISQYVRDPVTATALAIETEGESGNDQAIMISCDLVGISREVQERVRALAAPQLSGFDLRKLFLSATHTHTGPTIYEGWYPPVGPEVISPTAYVAFLVEQLAQVAVEAWQARQQGGVSWALARAVVGHNRRVVYRDGTAQMYGNTNRPDFLSLEGGSDTGMEMLFCWSPKRQLTGMIINAPCPSQVVESKYYVSADFWAETRRMLRQKYGEGLFVLPWTSAAGDQSPRDMVRHGLGEANFREEEGLIEIGERITEGIEEVYPYGADTIVTEAVFQHLVEELELPVRQVTPEEYVASKAAYAELMAQPDLDMTQNTWRVYRFRNAVERYERQNQRSTFGLELHVLRLGDIAIATNPFELYLDYGLRIKARSMALQTFVIQLCCDEGGYLATAKAVRGGGYSAEIYDNTVGPEGGQVLVDRSVELINSLWPADASYQVPRY